MREDKDRERDRDREKWERLKVQSWNEMARLAPEGGEGEVTEKKKRTQS